jgi:hypothetical protein
MKIFIGILFFLILISWTLKLKINIHHLYKDKNSLKVYFNVNVGIYLLGVIKIFGISFKEDGIYFLSIKIPYNKISIGKESKKILKEMPIMNTLKFLNLKIDKFKFILEVGSENMMLTVFSVFAISTFLSILSAKCAKQINLKHYYYQVTPAYNTNTLSFKSSAIISMRISNILKAIIFANNHTKKTYKVHIKKVPVRT